MAGYQLDEKLIARMQRHDVGSLEEEIRLAKALLEERLQACQTEAERIAMFPLAMQALTQVEKMTSDYRRFEELNGNTLRKSAIERLGRAIVDILVVHLKPLGNDELIDAIAKDIGNAIVDAKNLPDDKDEK